MHNPSEPHDCNKQESCHAAAVASVLLATPLHLAYQVVAATQDCLIHAHCAGQWRELAVSEQVQTQHEFSAIAPDGKPIPSQPPR